MRVADLVTQITHNIFAFKLRSLLAVIGIVWGAYTVVMLAAMGRGMYEQNQSKIEMISRPTMMVFSATTTKAYQGFAPGRYIRFKFDDIERMPKALAGVAAVTPILGKYASLQADSHSVKTGVNGVSVQYFSMFPSQYVGRLLKKSDITDKRRVVFLSQKIKAQLFQNANALGKSVEIEGIPFVVIGYTKKLKGSNGATFNNAVVPYSTFFTLWEPSHRVNGFGILLSNPDHSKAVEQEVRQYLAYHGHFSDSDKQALYIIDFTKITSTVTGLFVVIQVFLIFCGVMTLMVGGVGVANMMYFIIKERTKEIGLAMALGARPRDILQLILYETLSLIIAGGVFGMLLALLTLSVLHHMTLPVWLGEPKLTEWLAVVVWVILLLTAVIAGFFPARRAALMLPVEALQA